MVPVQNNMDCVTAKCLTVLSRMMYSDGSGPYKENYADYFHNLLYLQEYLATQNLRQYNMRDVTLKIVDDKCLELQVGISTLYMSVCGIINMRNISGGIITDLGLRLKTNLHVVSLTVLVSLPLIYVVRSSSKVS